MTLLELMQNIDRLKYLYTLEPKPNVLLEIASLEKIKIKTEEDDEC